MLLLQMGCEQCGTTIRRRCFLAATWMGPNRRGAYASPCLRYNKILSKGFLRIHLTAFVSYAKVSVAIQLHLSLNRCFIDACSKCGVQIQVYL